jgi:hypothetical protein
MPAKKQVKPSPRAKRPKSPTPHIFDKIFKQLLHLSSRAIISFINALFHTRHPLDSVVEHLATETISKELLLRRTSDIFIRINNVTYHLEAQTTFDADIMIRAMEYGLLYGVKGKTFDGDIRTIVFPQVRVIYLTTTGKKHDKQTLRLRFPDGFTYDYEVKTFNPLDHSVKELEKKGMALLLPFYVMKMRDDVAKADDAGRQKLSAKMKTLLDKLDEAVKNCKEKGQIDDQDALDIIRDLDRLYTELYGGYPEFAEDESMEEKYVRYSTQVMEEAKKQNSLEIAKNLLVDGLTPEKVAKNTNLSLRQVKALLKTLSVEQPA